MRTLKAIRNTFGCCGFVLLFLAISSSDYYVLELNTTEPRSVIIAGVLGFVMLLPALVSLIWEEIKNA